MAIAVSRRVREEDECENVERKVRRTRERQGAVVSPCRQSHFIDVSFEDEEKSRKPFLSQTLVDFDFGPPMLNLYQYVFEESYFLWSGAKEMCILRSSSEPQKGLFLFHGSDTNLKELCWNQFEFDPHSTSFSTVQGKQSRKTDMVCVFHIDEHFWKNTDMVTLLKQKKTFEKSQFFFITESVEARDQAVKFTEETKCCPSTNIFLKGSDKGIIYDKMYDVLQNQLESFLSDLYSRTSTRLVHKFTSQLESLLGKLRSRKNRQRSTLTKQCLSKIKSGFEFGIVGHRLCGNVLYIFEEEKMFSDPQKKIDFYKSIEETFKGKVYYKSIKEVMSPHCIVKCGGPIKNSLTGRIGTIGVFGKLIDPKLGYSQEKDNLIALSSGHVIHENTDAVLSVSKKIGVCIWPADSSDNIHDVSVIKIDQDLLNSVEDTILDEIITVGGIPKDELGYQRVFKYGATTGRTDGRIGVIGDFEIFGEDVMTILPRRSGCPNGLFSDKGDSGAIVLTRYKGNLHGIGVIYGGCLILPDCRNIHEETIAVFLKNAIDRFTSAKQRTIKLNRI